MSLRTSRAQGGEVNEIDAEESGDAFLTISPLLGALGNRVTGNSTSLKDAAFLYFLLVVAN